MNNLTKVKDQWIPLQNKAFSRWVSTQLQGTKSQQTINISKDLSDGTALIELAQKLTHKKIEQNWQKNPKSKIEKTQNCDLAINLFEKDGVKLIGISGKDISDNNEKLILGLIWSLITHYSIDKSIIQNSSSSDKNNNKSNGDSVNIKNKASVRYSLLTWANDQICNYSNIHNFKPYDLAICAILNSYFPEKIKYNQLKIDNHYENLNNAITVMNHLKIPVLIFPEDLKKCNYEVDEKTLLAQLSLIKDAINNKNLKIKYIEQKQDINDEKESESSSNSFDSQEHVYNNQVNIIETESQTKLSDEELADNEDNSIEYKAESDAKNQIQASLDSTDISNCDNDNKIKIKIRRKHGYSSNRKVKVLVKNSNGEVIEKTCKSRVSKLHLVIKQNKNTTKNDQIESKQQEEERARKLKEDEERIRKLQEEEEKIRKMREEEEERIRKLREEEEKIRKQRDEEDKEKVNQIENEKNLEIKELENLRREELEEEKLKELNKVKKSKLEEIESKSDSELTKVSNDKLEELSQKNDDEIEEVENAKKESFDQHKHEGQKFGLVMTLKGSDYNNGGIVEENKNEDGPTVHLALTLVHCEEQFLNSAGLKLDLSEADIKNNINQQFVFGNSDNYTAVDSECKRGMVWDVANADETNPPSGTPFYLYPFHGRHNQHFLYKNEMIYALQNNQVVTYVGGDVPLVMMPPQANLKSRQTFRIKFV